MGQLLLLGICNRTVDLVVIVVQAGDVCACELGNFPGGSSDTAANVQHALALLDANLVCQVVLMAGHGLIEGLAEGEAAEVEGLAPSGLINIGGKVVVAVVGEVSVAIRLYYVDPDGEVLTVSSKWRTGRSVPV